MSKALATTSATALMQRETSGRQLGLIAQMREDARAALRRDPAARGMSDIVLFSTGTHIVWSYRRNHWLWEHGFHGLALWLAKRARRKLGADIHPAATIGRRFTIDHGIGVVIGGTAVIGDDCMLYQGATLGMTGKQLEGKRHPTLGNNVLVGANAVGRARGGHRGGCAGAHRAQQQRGPAPRGAGVHRRRGGEPLVLRAVAARCAWGTKATSGRPEVCRSFTCGNVRIEAV